MPKQANRHKPRLLFHVITTFFTTSNLEVTQLGCDPIWEFQRRPDDLPYGRVQVDLSYSRPRLHGV